MAKINLAKIENTNILIILQTCKKLGIKVEVLDLSKYKFKLSQKGKTHIIWKKSMGLNSSSGINISRDKHLTYLTLKKADLPVLPQIQVKSLADYQKNYQKILFPQVIKPTFGEKGQNIYLNIPNKNQGFKALKKYFAKASSFSQPEKAYCVIEPYFAPALDYRFIVLAGQTIGLAQRQPPQIKTDGQHTIKELIKLENQQRLELNKKAGRRLLNRILVWSRVKWYLNQQGLQYTDVLPANQTITLYPIPNFSTGGSVRTIPLDQIHPTFLKLAQKISQVVNLKLMGLDLLIKNLKNPALVKNCAIVEVNSDPGLRLHDWPNQGKPQGATEKILRYIFKS